MNFNELKRREMQWHISYLMIAQIIAGMSRANKRKVGAILVKDDRIISTGFNGTPAGFDNGCEEYKCTDESDWETLGTCGCEFDNLDKTKCKHYKLITKPEVLHAESNAIAKCARSSESSKDAVLYLTLSPCFNCAKLIIQAGVKAVYYIDEWENDTSGLRLLIKAGIYYQQIIF